MNEEVVKLTPEEEVVIEVTETIGWAAGDATLHNSLGGRDVEDQHPIKSIIGLRAELDEIEKLKTVYSDKLDTATYYKWNGNSYGDGYFVSLVPGTSTVTLCNGDSNIFGVTVSEAGFVGGQDADIPRDDSYALVVTSGLVDVRCADNVAPGDYVVAGEGGMAQKIVSNSQYHGGYKVVAVDTKDGIKYVSIALCVQADITNVLALNLDAIDKRLQAAESNIIIVGNRADDAFDKATDADETSKDASEKADGAIGSVNQNTTDVGNLSSKVDSAIEISNAAKNAANDAMSYAEQNCKEAIDTANESWAKAQSLKDDEYSLRVNIDKYSVGEYSQAYGLTLEQAASILDTGMIYVPTKHPTEDDHTEEYPYTNQIKTVSSVTQILDPNLVYYVESDQQYWYCENNKWNSMSELPTYTRTFTPGYLYQWAQLSSGKYGWQTIDKNYNPATASEAVYFMPDEPTIAEADTFGYWYTDGDVITDKNGNTGIYKSYALYKCEMPQGGDTYSWVLVATRAANTLNRTVGITNLTANEAAFSVYNARGSMASMDARLTETEARVTDMAKWVNVDGSYNLGLVDVSADKDGSTMVLGVKHVDDTEMTQCAGLILNQNENGSSITLAADHIMIGDENLFTKPEETGYTKIKGNHIETGSLTVDAANITGILTIADTNGKDLFVAGDNRVNIGGWDIYRYGMLYEGETNGNKYTLRLGAVDDNSESRRISLRSDFGDFIVASNDSSSNNFMCIAVDKNNNNGFSISNGRMSLLGNIYLQDNLNVISQDDYTFMSHNSFSMYRRDSESNEVIQSDIRPGYLFIGDASSRYGLIVEDPLEAGIYLGTQVRGGLSVDIIFADMAEFKQMVQASGEATTSDKNKKNSIVSLPNNYDTMFDNLNSVIFKYNDGTSDRYHVGFIAQDVKDAMDTANLTTQDFAGLCIADAGTDDETWRLRYSEFVALNTDQIQKLKARVAELEKIINDLRGE